VKVMARYYFSFENRRSTSSSVESFLGKRMMERITDS